MEVAVNMLNTGCILMSAVVTVPSLMMMTLIVSEESLVARDRHTDRHTDFSLVYCKTLLKVVCDFEMKTNRPSLSPGECRASASCLWPRDTD